MYVGIMRPPIQVILLSIVTCGIYAVYWRYVVMEDINKVVGREVINPLLFLLLSIFCAPVLYYILYVVDKELLRTSAEEGTYYNNTNFLIWLLFTLLFGVGIFIAMWQITSAFNEIWAKRSGY